MLENSACKTCNGYFLTIFVVKIIIKISYFWIFYALYNKVQKYAQIFHF
jgi:hypothetical protein